MEYHSVFSMTFLGMAGELCGVVSLQHLGTERTLCLPLQTPGFGTKVYSAVRSSTSA